MSYEWGNDWGVVEDLHEEYEYGDGDITIVYIFLELNESTEHFGEWIEEILHQLIDGLSHYS